MVSLFCFVYLASSPCCSWYAKTCFLAATCLPCSSCLCWATLVVGCPPRCCVALCKNEPAAVLGSHSRSVQGLSKLIKCIKSSCCCCCSASNRHHTRHHSPTHRRPAHGSGGDNATEDINEQASDEEHEEEEEAAPELGQGLPPLVGMLVVGIILRNLPDNMALSGLSPDWMGAIRNIAVRLCFAFCRSVLSSPLSLGVYTSSLLS